MTDAPLLSLCFAKSEDDVQNSLLAVVDAHPTLFFDPAAVQSRRRYLLIFEGLTFNFQIGRFGRAIAAEHQIFLSAPVSQLASYLAVDFGPNLAGAHRVPALAKAYLELAALLAAELSAQAVYVPAAGVLCGSTYFCEASNSYKDGGPFPALALIAFNVVDDHRGFQTRGLRHFAGQELRFESETLSESEMMRRVVRLVHDMATNGPVEMPETLPDIETGQSIVLAPTDDGTNAHASLRFGAE